MKDRRTGRAAGFPVNAGMPVMHRSVEPAAHGKPFNAGFCYPRNTGNEINQGKGREKITENLENIHEPRISGWAAQHSSCVCVIHISQNLPQTGAAFCADGSYKYRKIHAENGGLWILGTCDLPSNAEIPQGFVLKMNASTLQVEHFAYMDQIIDRTYYTKNTTVSFPGGQDITGDRRYYQRMGHLVDFRSVESCSSPNITVKPKAGQDTSLCVADGIGVRNVDSFAWPFYFTTYIYVDSKKTNLGDPRVMVCGSEKNCMFQQYVATNPSSLLQTVIDPASGSVAFRKQVGQYNAVHSYINESVSLHANSVSNWETGITTEFLKAMNNNGWSRLTTLKVDQLLLTISPDKPFYNTTSYSRFYPVSSRGNNVLIFGHMEGYQGPSIRSTSSAELREKYGVNRYGFVKWRTVR